MKIIQNGINGILIEPYNTLSMSKGIIDLFGREGFECLKQGSYGADASILNIKEPHKSAYDAIAKQYDFGATQLLRFKLNEK